MYAWEADAQASAEEKLVREGAQKSHKAWELDFRFSILKSVIFDRRRKRKFCDFTPLQAYARKLENGTFLHP